MLDKLTHEQFANHRGERFRLKRGDAPQLDVTLAEVQALRESSKGGDREPFSLTFVGPAEPALPQQIYPVEHPELGELEMFLVPIGPDPETQGMRYEAVFT